MIHSINNILHITYDYGSNKKRGGKPLPEKVNPVCCPLLPPIPIPIIIGIIGRKEVR
jgi:hypothetical protein